MRLPGEDEGRNSGLSIKYMVVGVSLCLVLILGVVVFTNMDNQAKKQKQAEKETAVMALEHEQSGQEETGAGQGASAGAGQGASAGAGQGASAGAGQGASAGAGQGASAGAGQGTNEGTASGDAQQASGGTNGDTAQESASGSATVAGFGGRKSMQDIERLYQEHKLTASDLDFWDMYPEGDSGIAGSENSRGQEEGAASAGDASSKYAKYEEEAEKVEEEDPAEDGKHTRIVYADGSEEWVLINPYLEKNTYDFTKLEMKSDKMAYYENGRKTSYIGADLSKYNNDVDFMALKESGIDYVMIRLGSRGYGSGQITPDEKFVENMTKAAEAGLETGVYFFSQAVTAEEAVEEANYVIQSLGTFQITYPVAFDMEYVENDKARIEALSREEKTTVAKAFLDTVKNAGYKPMVYGTKEWLIKQVDLTKLTGYDIWLSDQGTKPDYPYQFQMWQYTLEGSVGGVEGDVDLNISFVDYSEK